MAISYQGCCHYGAIQLTYDKSVVDAGDALPIGWGLRPE